MLIQILKNKNLARNRLKLLVPPYDATKRPHPKTLLHKPSYDLNL